MASERRETSDELRKLIEQEAESAEAARGQEFDGPLPDHVKVSRPGRARSKVLQVRLNPDELDALEAIAARRDLPVSTIAREQILKLLAQDEAAAAPGTVLAAVTQLVTLATSIQDSLEDRGGALTIGPIGSRAIGDAS